MLALLDVGMDNWEQIIIFSCFAKCKKIIILFTFAEPGQLGMDL